MKESMSADTLRNYIIDGIKADEVQSAKTAGKMAQPISYIKGALLEAPEQLKEALAASLAVSCLLLDAKPGDIEVDDTVARGLLVSVKGVEVGSLEHSWEVDERRGLSLTFRFHLEAAAIRSIQEVLSPGQPEVAFGAPFKPDVDSTN